MFISEIYLDLLFSSDFDDGEILVGRAGPPGLHLDVQQPGRGGRRTALALHLLRSLRYSTEYIIHNWAERIRDFRVPQRNNDDSAIVGEIFVSPSNNWFLQF
jgi:hypothetical protein